MWDYSSTSTVDDQNPLAHGKGRFSSLNHRDKSAVIGLDDILHPSLPGRRLLNSSTGESADYSTAHGGNDIRLRAAADSRPGRAARQGPRAGTQTTARSLDCDWARVDDHAANGPIDLSDRAH